MIQPLYQPIRPNREALGKQIAHQIEQLIFSERLLPGDKLPPERDLSDQLGVSRTAVRDVCATMSSLFATCINFVKCLNQRLPRWRQWRQLIRILNY
ncbi:MAG: FadR family transcriptional regulator [Chloroflexi bacterium]|nr:FadR family transcriptional regulator [Chloroflexota bacterium]